MDNIWKDLGRQIATARKDRGLSQAELASRLKVARHAITKREMGARKIDSLELARLAKILHRPLHWFIENAPSYTTINRPCANEATETKARDARIALDTLIRDVAQLEALGVLEQRPLSIQISTKTAETAARTARERAGLEFDTPVWKLTEVSEHLGLYAFLFSDSPSPDAPSEDSYIIHARK